MATTSPVCHWTTTYAIVVMSTVVLLGVEAAPATNHVDMGCVQTQFSRRCFTLHKIEKSWAQAAAQCGEMIDSRLAVIDKPDIEQKLSSALMLLEDDSSDDSGYMAWTAGREMKQQLEWNWLNGHSFHAAEAKRLGVKVQLTSAATVYKDCATVSVNSQPETHLAVTSHKCRSTMSHLLCQTADVHDEEECSIGGKVGLLLGNNCFAVMTSSGLSWYKAVSHCVSLGASLANAVDIHSKQSLSQLADYLSLSGLDGQPLWIGLNRRPWAWVQSFDPMTGETVVTTPMIYTYWVVPKLRSDADQQNCISIGCDDGRCGWSDESCTNELPYICEHSETLATSVTGSGDGSLMPAVDYAVGDDDDTKPGTVSATTIAPGTGSTVSGSDSTSMLKASTNTSVMVTDSNTTYAEAPGNYTATIVGNGSMTNESVPMLSENDFTVPQNSSVSSEETDVNTTTSETNFTVPDGTIAAGNGSIVTENDSTSMSEASTNTSMMVFNTSETDSNTTYAEAPGNYSATIVGNGSMTNESLSSLPGNDSMSLPMLPANDSTVPRNSSVSLEETDVNTTTSESNFTLPDETIAAGNGFIVAGNDSTTMEASTNTSMTVFNTSETDYSMTYAEAPGNYSATIVGNSSTMNESLTSLPGNDSMSLPMLSGNDSTVLQNSSVSLTETDLNTTTSETNFTAPDGTIASGNVSTVAGNLSVEASDNDVETTSPANDTKLAQNSSFSMSQTDFNTTTSETNFTVHGKKAGNGSTFEPDDGFKNMSRSDSRDAQEIDAVTSATGSETNALRSGNDDVTSEKEKKEKNDIDNDDDKNKKENDFDGEGDEKKKENSDDDDDDKHQDDR